MTISVTDAIRQNTVGMSEGSPLGVPSDYSWYTGVVGGTSAPPANFTSVTGWGQVYLEKGSTYSNPNATIDVANTQTWVHLKATNQWVQVQSQANNPLEGNHFVSDFSGNAAIAMPVKQGSNGTATMATPPSGYNDHFWNANRGEFAPGTVDGVYVQMDMKISDPNQKVVANIGADWWATPTANYVDGFDNNPGVGMSNWLELTDQYRTLSFYSGSAAEFQANPPPPVTGAVTTEPGRPGVTNPSEDSPPVVVTPPSTDTKPGVNLLKNGSFEATAHGTGHHNNGRGLQGWTALPGSKAALSSGAGGVRATDGHNFVEFGHGNAHDGLSQSIKTSAGQTLKLSIDAIAKPGASSASSRMEVMWNGTVVSTINPGTDWKTYSVEVTGTGRNDTLTLREPNNQALNRAGTLIDNVKLVSSPTPAPAIADSFSLAPENQTLGFSAQPDSTAVGHVDNSSHALFRQFVSSAFVPQGAFGTSNHAPDQHAMPWGQMLTRPHAT
jgi:hypothetical protein